MKKIIITLVVLILIAGAGYGGYWYGTGKDNKELDSNAVLKNSQESQSQKQNIDNSWELTGIYNLEGYMEVEHIFCSEGGMGCDSDYDYAYFVITKTDNDSIYSLLGEGNSYLKKDAIGLGCYEPSTKRIFSNNFSGKTENGGVTENIIMGGELESLKNSNEKNQVKFQVEKPEPTGGRGAPNCYSHFINFKVFK